MPHRPHFQGPDDQIKITWSNIQPILVGHSLAKMHLAAYVTRFRLTLMKPKAKCSLYYIINLYTAVEFEQLQINIFSLTGHHWVRGSD